MRTRKIPHLPRFVCLALVCLLFASALPLLAGASAPGEDRNGWTAWIESVSTPSTTFSPGENVNMTVTVERGPDTLTAVWDGELVLAVIDWTGDAVHTDDLPVELWVGGAQQTSYFEFDLAEPGDYTLHTSLYWMNGTLVDQKELNITVGQGSPPGDAAVWISTLETDEETYQKGDMMAITVIVTRGNDMLTHVWEGTLELQVLGGGIVTPTTWQRAIYLPSGGNTQTLSFTADLADGGDRILVATLYWMDGTFVEERRLNVTVSEPDPNQPPVAVIDPANQTIGVTDTARIDGSLSHDDDGSISSYVWDMGDGTTATGAMVAHTYRSPGLFTVTLTVTDDDGATSVATGAVRVLAFNPPPPDDQEAWIVSVTTKGTVNESEPVTVVADVIRGDDMLDYVWTGTLVLEVLNDGTVLRLTEQVELATGGEVRSYTFEFTLTDPVDHLVRVALYRQDGELMDTEDVLIDVLGPVKGPEDTGLPDVSTTAVAAAGLVVILGALAATEVGKVSLLGLLVPLFTKLKKEDVLEHFTRGKIYGYILANPGDHYNSIQKALDIPNGTFAYHLRVLEKEGFIRSARYGTRKCFFPANMRVPPEDDTLKASQRLIVEKILEEPGISQKDIASSLGVSSATISYHIKGLLRLGLVETERRGMRLAYYINRDLNPAPA
jgi:predicted transcriptional regulator